MSTLARRAGVDRSLSPRAGERLLLQGVPRRTVESFRLEAM
jgi:hypothetical protein